MHFTPFHSYSLISSYKTSDQCYRVRCSQRPCQDNQLPDKSLHHPNQTALSNPKAGALWIFPLRRFPFAHNPWQPDRSEISSVIWLWQEVQHWSSLKESASILSGNFSEPIQKKCTIDIKTLWSLWMNSLKYFMFEAVPFQSNVFISALCNYPWLTSAAVLTRLFWDDGWKEANIFLFAEPLKNSCPQKIVAFSTFECLPLVSRGRVKDVPIVPVKMGLALTQSLYGILPLMWPQANKQLGWIWIWAEWHWEAFVILFNRPRHFLKDNFGI